MRALICDVDPRELGDGSLADGFDVVVGRETLEAGHACMGCFSCWTRTPGVCVMHDGLKQLGALLGSADELWIVSHNSFGTYSPLAKRAIDRTLPYLHPCFRVLAGELHHRMRYDGSLRSGGAGVRLRETIWLYGPSSMAERESFLAAVRANQVNQQTDVRGVWFCDGPADVGRQDTSADAWDAYRTRIDMDRGTSWHCTELAGLVDAPQPACRPKTPREIALLNGSPRGDASASQLLLDDFADALVAYDRISSRGLSDEGTAKPPLIRRLRSMPSGELREEDTETNAAAHGAGNSLEPAGTLASCDALVIVYPLYADALPSNLLTTLEDLACSGALARETLVYAICNLGFYEPSQIGTSFLLLQNWCRAAGLLWCGGLAVGGGGMLTGLARSPRMGFMRRHTSEGTDRLIAAVRSGLSVCEAATAYGASTREAELAKLNIIEARCSVPRALYRAGAEAGWRRSCRASGADINAAPPYTADLE